MNSLQIYISNIRMSCFYWLLGYKSEPMFNREEFDSAQNKGQYLSQFHNIKLDNINWDLIKDFPHIMLKNSITVAYVDFFRILKKNKSNQEYTTIAINSLYDGTYFNMHIQQHDEIIIRLFMLEHVIKDDHFNPLFEKELLQRYISRFINIVNKEILIKLLNNPESANLIYGCTKLNFDHEIYKLVPAEYVRKADLRDVVYKLKYIDDENTLKIIFSRFDEISSNHYINISYLLKYISYDSIMSRLDENNYSLNIEEFLGNTRMSECVKIIESRSDFKNKSELIKKVGNYIKKYRSYLMN